MSALMLFQSELLASIINDEQKLTKTVKDKKKIQQCFY